MKLWQKKYQLNKQIENFTVGEDYILDRKLLKYDCVSSIAHAQMLAKIGVLSQDEARQLTEELNHVIELAGKNDFHITQEHEDCHTAIEEHLTGQFGDLGKKIHTGRSRNDQVLTALRLFYKDELNACRDLLNQLQKTLADFSAKFEEVPFPGYTHMRKAMPSSMTLWAHSFIDSLSDNEKLIEAAYQLVDQSPLGTGAGYGVPLKLDREFTAHTLGFKRVQENPIYAQNSRGKFEATILHTLTQIMFDLNKIACDLIVFSMPEFGYFELPHEFCTGSSIMPHKKNPDVFELMRAKYHVVVSYEFQLKNISANLISGYNRDLQLTKEATIKSFQITQDCLSITSLIFTGLNVNEKRCQEAMTEELFATEDVYRLVEKGVPFREAYQAISKKF
ncbi:MAG: argininosuccinate lyase [bacterium]